MHRGKFTFTSWHGTHYSQFAYEVPLKNNAFELKEISITFPGAGICKLSLLEVRL